MSEIRNVTPQEGNIIRAATALNDWNDVCGLGRDALGRELTKHEAWEAGRRAADLWRDLTGLRNPSYAPLTLWRVRCSTRCSAMTTTRTETWNSYWSTTRS